jgi:hypothetical protein
MGFVNLFSGKQKTPPPQGVDEDGDPSLRLNLWGATL